jgi:glycosyltransferase involved in cell wall biosynthesis
VFRGNTLAVVFPTYREKASIRRVIEGFEALQVVDELIVVNNNAETGTSEEVEATSAREVLETRQGYGAAIRRGLSETQADLICIVEPDGTFEPADLWKLLAFADEFDFVFGSRTVRDFIWDDANMGRFLRWGNWGVAKLIEMLFNTNSLSDVGCTMRLVSGPAVRQLLPHFTIDGGEFGPEMMLLSIISRWRTIQIPVNYRARDGRGGTTTSISGALEIGLRMILLIVRYRRRREQIARQLLLSGVRGREWPEGVPRPGGEPRHMFRRRQRQAARARDGEAPSD